MNILDIIILITLVPTVIVGLRKGFISQAVSVLVIFVGIWASSLFANTISNWLSTHITANEGTLKIASFAIIFTIVFIVLTILGKWVEKMINLTFLSWVNKGLGVIMSIINYSLIVGVALIAFDYINLAYEIMQDTSIFDESVLCDAIKKIADTAFPYVTKLLHIA